MPRVTAAIPTHNRGHLVVDALTSVLAQTYSNVEVIVVDNGSTDDTEEQLRPYFDRITYVKQENRGRAGARNRAIALARGTYVAFLDSDDAWLPDRLERQVPLLDRDPGTALVHGYVEVMDDAGRPIAAQTREHRKLWAKAHSSPVTYARYANECRCFTSTVLVRRDVLEELGGYDETIGLEDLDLYLRIAMSHRIAFLGGAPLARYRFHGAQTANEELTRGQIAVSHKHLRLLNDLPRTRENRRARRNFLMALSWSHHVLLERRASRRYALAAVRLDPRVLGHRAALRALAVSLAPDRLVARLRERRSPAGLGGNGA